MDYLKIPLTKKQISLLERIAKADDRRLEDLINLVFSCGLSVYFCERSICVSKNDDEYTEDKIKQKAINDKLLKDNPKFHYQSQDEQKA
jgi:predicted peroxiredoxin